MADWERIRTGDRQAFETFYFAHAGRVQQFLRRMTGDRQAAEEITQEVFLQLWKRPNGFDATRGSLICYVFEIARKLGAEWWRRRVPAELDALKSDQDVGSASHPQRPTAETGMMLED